MTDLHMDYQTIIEQSMTMGEAKTYTAQNLTWKLETKYANKVQIMTTELRGKPNIVNDRDLKL